MSAILTVTLNPTVDLATATPQVVPEVKLRCAAPQVDPGGGGINVARAIRLLGGSASALIAIGGARGAQLLGLLAEEGVPVIAFQGPGETRLSITVSDEGTGLQYRFVTPGPDWTQPDVDRAMQAIDRAVAEQGLIVLSGSQPPGIAKDFPRLLAAHVARKGARLIVDTSGPALHRLVEAPQGPVFVLRTDSAEAEALAGRPLPRVADSADFARALVGRGVAQAVVLARDAEGSVLATAEGAWIARPPVVPVVSKVGAGDSLIGALTLALSRGAELPEALRQGAAAAAAAVTTPATQLCQRADFDRVLQECTIARIS